MRRFIVRTSDRSTFKRCRRKWGFQSAHRMNRRWVSQENYFWIGTVGHFALEDFHGYNRYGHPVEAAKACIQAHITADRINKQKKIKAQELPDDWKVQAEVIYGVLDHYVGWLQTRNIYKTYWHEGVPQVEAVWRIPLTQYFDQEMLRVLGIDEVHYEVTLDRIVVDENGEHFVMDYKFYKQFHNDHLDYDQQASAYVWAANCLYPGIDISGFVLHQFRKSVPEAPAITSKGQITTNIQTLASSCTYYLYKQALKAMYGSVQRAPPQHRRALADLAELEHETRDNYIRYDKSYRNQHQIAATGQKILMEIEDMMNPDLPLYPNETKDCSWECSFRDVCIMMDRNDHWQEYLEESTIPYVEEATTWRKHLP